MFEPDPVNYALIMGTIRKNAISDCQAMNVALSDRAGEAPFIVDPASGATGSLEATSNPENTHSLHHAYRMNETITCRTATIDGLVEQGVPPPDLIKIDVEGAESLVLAGAKSALASYRPTMIVETDSAGLVRSLLPADYTAFRIDSGNRIFCAATDESILARLSEAFPEI